jgi:hypothetical protein
MKKVCFVVMVVVFSVLCNGASIWEGAAAVSIGGELPEGGYYAATKSFPRNTIVDITNLETGKSVRAIVAAGLDSPGLLAILSREAADLIGIQARSIGRIRMTMPSDPVAFSRFTEGSNPNRDPDHDPQALIAAAAPRQSSQSPAQPVIPPGAFSESENIPVWETPEPLSPAAERPAPPPAGTARPGSEVIPRDTPASGNNIPWPLDLPPAASAEPDRTPASGNNVPWPLELPPVASAEPDPVPFAAEQPEERYDSREYSYQPPVSTRQDGIVPEQRPELARPRENTPPNTITLVPAETRPPEPYTSLPLDAEIRSITSSAPVAVAPREEDVKIPEEYIIPGISRAPESGMNPEAVLPAQEPAVRPAVQPDTTDTQTLVLEETVPSNDNTRFSAPFIAALERGMYYLQLGAYSKPDLVESELSRIGGAYPLAVQNGGSFEKPLYRILVGPVNLGESSALLQRFKGNGYRDAFVRRDG